MSATLRPTSEAELVDIVSSAVASKTPLAPVGHGTKSGIGRPVNHLQLDMGGIAGIVDYEPEELILTVKAGTPVDEVMAVLAAHGQDLPFEPIGGVDEAGNWAGGTIGGMVMTNFAGPRRIKVGAVRDHVLGLRAVSGRAESFKAGGKVVKNVTGYDLSRGLCGSWGTLAVVSEVTFKVLPKAETEATIIVPRLALAEAVEILTGTMQQSFDVSSAAYLPAGLTGPAAIGQDDTHTLIRLEGFEASVKARIDQALRFVGGRGGVDVVTGDASRGLWQWMTRIHALGPATPVLWRLSVPPASAARVSETIRSALAATAKTTFAYDWSGGLIWLWLDGGPEDLGSTVIRTAIAANGGGHAMLMRGPIEARGRVDVFEPQSAALAALSKRLKHQFDPEGILNPGRMGGEG